MPANWRLRRDGGGHDLPAILRSFRLGSATQFPLAEALAAPARFARNRRSRLAVALGSGVMTEVVRGLSGAAAGRIGELRAAGRFSWIDVSLSESTARELTEVLDVPEAALRALLAFGEERS